ncbi:Gustatory Receptor [Nesidiocoris tenuis]|uniref:Gustatory receptor n=1 Tax=Nesidiocoris tenuis TaxID=355587 RepID=A0ABN7AI78_9HEMI|nr:Gustatory Receptor [Nesidiocoris tenuis]
MLFYDASHKLKSVTPDSVHRQFDGNMPMATGSELRPLFAICQILGALPVNSRFKYSQILWLWSFLVIGIFNVAVLTVQVYGVILNWGVWDMIRIVLQIVTRVIRFFTTTSHLYVLVRKRRLHTKILNTISVANLSAMNLYYKGVFVLLLLGSVCSAYALLIYSDPNTVIMNLSSLVQFAQIICILLLFCTYIEIANSEIAKNTESLREYYRINWIVDRHLTRLQYLRSCNKFFNLQLFLTHAFLTYYFVYSCFTIVTQLGNKNYVLLVAYVCFHSTCLFSILLVNRACQDSATEAEKFNAELFRLMRENQELCKNEKLQLYVTMKQTVNFTACGFFTLGYPLVTSIIAAATTYLVILVQFSMPPSKT